MELDGPGAEGPGETPRTHAQKGIVRREVFIHQRPKRKGSLLAKFGGELMKVSREEAILI